MDFTKEQFINFWGEQGYQEGFASNYNFQSDIENVIKKYSSKEYDLLEIGCGSGYWTRSLLYPNFKSVHAVDLINNPFKYDPIKYTQLDKADYTLSMFEDNVFDFVWCFGVFCHFSNSASQVYLNNIYRVLKPGGQAIIMFADWHKRNNVFGHLNKEEYREKSYDGWFYCDLETAQKQSQNAGFKTFENLLPSFRDTLARMVK